MNINNINDNSIRCLLKIVAYPFTIFKD